MCHLTPVKLEDSFQLGILSLPRVSPRPNLDGQSSWLASTHLTGLAFQSKGNILV